jgi:hypothetical protein
MDTTEQVVMDDSQAAVDHAHPAHPAHPDMAALNAALTPSLPPFAWPHIGAAVVNCVLLAIRQNARQEFSDQDFERLMQMLALAEESAREAPLLWP